MQTDSSLPHGGICDGHSEGRLWKPCQTKRCPGHHQRSPAYHRVRKVFKRTVSAIPEPYDNEYLSPVNVAGKIMHLALDTGSADLASHDYNVPPPGKLPMNGTSWEVNYGDGSFASSNVYIDRVSIFHVVSPSQSIQTAQKVGESFIVDSNLDSVLGLAFPSFGLKKKLGFFDNVKNTLREPLFAVSLKKNKPGTFNFGFIDDDKYNGNITYTPVHDTGFWSLSTTGYAVGNSTSNTSAPIKGFLGTGTTLMLLPEPIINDYYSLIPGSAKVSGLANAFFNDPLQRHYPAIFSHH
ncbi:hypothetical protein ACJ73_00587 [Blastomyces percursus]|uniref:Peptidase A1 domain-containing protein n=1 Tax=Blastomyces percursus TaxID=1658174 RepID=A0A1J9QHN8_9EURO|nr:hypothetical protein ACJ73_00587 [Blastomyces percursus]